VKVDTNQERAKEHTQTSGRRKNAKVRKDVLVNSLLKSHLIRVGTNKTSLRSADIVCL
jgi:hypothetical protein